MTAEPILLFVSAGGRDEAERLGEALVEERLAACVNIIPVVHSFYRWEGRVQREHEALLLVKTNAERVDAAQQLIRERHSYELPEILRVKIDGGLPPYLEWMARELSEPPAVPDSAPADA